MRTYALAVAAAVFAFPLTASSQSIEFGPGGIRFGEGRGRGPDCAELRIACLNKDRLGEQGESNCRRYRNLCRGGQCGASGRDYGASGEGEGGGRCRVITSERVDAYGDTVIRRRRICD